MSYSNAYFPNDQLDFPRPPLWLVWTCEDTWSQSEYTVKHNPEKAAEAKGKGKVRHMESLDKAKKRVSRYAANKHALEWFQNRHGRAIQLGEFYEDWAIYEWTGDKYELRYSAQAGDMKVDNPLFRTPVKKGTGKRERTATEEDIEAAKLSILGAA